MERTTAGTSPWGGPELLERAIGYLRWSLTSVTDDAMAATTPCAEWDLRMLLLHVDDSMRSLHVADSARRVGPDAPQEDPGDLVATVRGRACTLLGGWSADWSWGGAASTRDVLVRGRPLTSPVLVTAGALEVAVHGWDIATACGVRQPIPDRLAADLLRVAPLLVTPGDRPERFAAALTPRPASSPGEALLAFLGRASW